MKENFCNQKGLQIIKSNQKSKRSSPPFKNQKDHQIKNQKDHPNQKDKKPRGLCRKTDLIFKQIKKIC